VPSIFAKLKHEERNTPLETRSLTELQPIAFTLLHHPVLDRRSVAPLAIAAAVGWRRRHWDRGPNAVQALALRSVPRVTAKACGSSTSNWTMKRSSVDKKTNGGS
jgi:hypothetical protein